MAHRNPLHGIELPNILPHRNANGAGMRMTAEQQLDSADADWLTVTTKARVLTEAGNAVPLLDLLIATIAYRHRAVLAHRDAHFNAIVQVLPVQTHDFQN
ncbi:MAG: hypothetical protein OXG04_23035 [Acidobacteria bacterium]|nr:hypothetical protein [Acidobacteriota bacterium]